MTHPATLLVIEDRPEVRTLFRLALKPLPVTVHEVDHGRAGLEAARALRPGLILLDIMMPGELDGLSVCRALKGDPALAGIPVVLVSALAQDSDRQAGLEAGADAYLTKPFSLADLSALVERYLGPFSG